MNSKTYSTIKLPDRPIFNSETKTRLFNRGGDYLLAFGSGTGTTLLTNFIRIAPKPPRLTYERNAEGYAFEYAPLHHFQADGRFDEHLRHWDSGDTLYTRHWLWSTRRHRFVVTSVSHLKRWDGWDDESLK